MDELTRDRQHMPQLWPQAVEWDPDNIRPVDPAYTTPYLNLERFPITY